MTVVTHTSFRQTFCKGTNPFYPTVDLVRFNQGGLRAWSEAFQLMKAWGFRMKFILWWQTQVLSGCLYPPPTVSDHQNHSIRDNRNQTGKKRFSVALFPAETVQFESISEWSFDGWHSLCVCLSLCKCHRQSRNASLLYCWLAHVLLQNKRWYFHKHGADVHHARDLAAFRLDHMCNMKKTNVLWFCYSFKGWDSSNNRPSRSSRVTLHRICRHLLQNILGNI